MKPCPHCGKELPQELQFCPYCMEKLMPETVVAVTAAVRRHPRWPLWAVSSVLALTALACVLWLLLPRPADGSVSAGVGTTTSSDGGTTTSTDSGTTTHATSATTTSSAPTTAVTGGATALTTPTASAPPTTLADLCAGGHDWVPVTQSVHVDEVGHYESKRVEKQMTLFRCALCYEEFGVLEDYYAHFDGQHDGDSLQAIFRDRYETVTEYREVEEQQWVVDTPAYDETITVGRQCTVCGKTEDHQ